jgi:hypothetical protein
MYVRWLGAFASQATLSESISFEMNRLSEVACEHFTKKSNIQHSTVGLLVDPKAIIKRWTGDVWSEYEGIHLVATRKPWEAGKGSKHTECWAKPSYTGILIQGSFQDLKRNAREELRKAVSETGLPVYELKKGRLNPVTIL